MKWATENYRWRKRFAFLPVWYNAGPTTHWIWWDWYWYRPYGDLIVYRFVDPTSTDHQQNAAQGGGENNG